MIISKRDLVKVIEHIMAVIPDCVCSNIRGDLNEVRRSAMYAAPEMMPHWWQKAAEVLFEHFPDSEDLERWQKDVIKIWVPDLDL